ncbi:hypothetical protein AALA44_08455 [Enterococcus ratti]
MKKAIIMVSSFLSIITLFFIIESLTSPVKDVTSKAEMQSTVEPKMEYVPTKEELLKIEGEKLDFLGFYQIIKLKFDDQPSITLLNEDQETINFSISVLDKKKQIFSIPAIQFSPQNLQLSDSFGLAKKETHYFAYKKN